MNPLWAAAQQTWQVGPRLARYFSCARRRLFFQRLPLDFWL